MKLTVGTDGALARLDAYLADHTALSRTAVARLCADGAILVGGKPAAKNARLTPGTEIVWEEPAPAPAGVEAQELPLDIVYEDGDLLVVNKPVGMVVHPAPGNPDGTLVNALLFHCRGELSGVGGVERPGIVHRIDKDTAGLLVVAKNDFAHAGLTAQMAHHGISRVYHALAVGGFREATGTVDAPIGRHPKDRKKMAVIRDGSHTAREAVTHYRVLEDFGNVTYLELRLETGRTHQIRVHMASLGHPLLGDTLYGGGHTAFEKSHAAYLHGQALIAKKLSFLHPRTGEQMHFEVPLTADFEKLLQILRTRG